MKDRDFTTGFLGSGSKSSPQGSWGALQASQLDPGRSPAVWRFSCTSLTHDGPPCAENRMYKKALALSETTQTLRAGCSKAEPKIFAPPQTPFSGARDGQNVISWRRSLPSPTDPIWWRSMHAISSYRGNRPTNKQTNTQTDRGDYNTLRRSLARSVNIKQWKFHPSIHPSVYFADKNKQINIKVHLQGEWKKRGDSLLSPLTHNILLYF